MKRILLLTLTLSLGCGRAKEPATTAEPFAVSMQQLDEQALRQEGRTPKGKSK